MLLMVIWYILAENQNLAELGVKKCQISKIPQIT